MIDYEAVLDWAIENSMFHTSPWHGVEHWRAVADTAQDLALKTPDTDNEVAHLFGLLHDFKRLEEGKDDKHGERAALYINEIRTTLLKDLTDLQFKTLQYAIYKHNWPIKHKNPTIACCWDADRLHIGRVGLKVNKRYLSTLAARDLIVT